MAGFTPRWRSSPPLRVHETSRGKPRFFPSVYLPHLRCGFPNSYRALVCLATLPAHLRLMRFLFVRPEVCLDASFRFHLAMDTLALGYALPAIGRARDFHPLETCACSAHQDSAAAQARAASKRMRGLPRVRAGRRGPARLSPVRYVPAAAPDLYLSVKGKPYSREAS